MSIPIEYRIRDSELPFTDSEIKLIKQNITDLYKTLKYVYDRPKLQSKPYNSLTHYKIKKQRVFYRPDEFYHITIDEIEVHIQKRKGGFYSVAVIGFIPDFRILNDFEKMDNLSPLEQEYTCGYSYYGYFKASDFAECIITFYKIIFCALCQKLGVEYMPIIQQLEIPF